MKTRESKKIYITHGAEYRAVEECIYEENLLFGDVYAQARDCLEEIIKISEQMQNAEQGADSELCEPYEEQGHYGKRKPENIVRRRSSNLIAFCAERGGGKTSAMISFVRALQNLRRAPNKNEQKEEFWKGKKAFGYHYEIVPSIDPTSMEIDDSILKMVLAHMYANFQERVKSQRETGTFGHREEQEHEDLIREFLKCFHFANRLNYKTKRPVPMDLEDELEFMEDRECGDTFRVQLYKLFEDYLQYMAPKKQAMLVISIDDADVNTARVYDLLEDVRKYLQMPNVVVMMATNMTQLESTVEQHFLEQYKTSLKHADSMVSVERCHSIAEFYLKKIVSSTRQLNLPSLSEELQTSEGNVEIVYRDKKEPKKNLLAVQEIEEGKEENRYGGIYQWQLLGLLHRKTGLIFIPPKGYLHDFLPTGMRELTHFLAFLCDMPDVEATYDTIVSQVMRPEEEQRKALLAWQKNLKQLQHYLIHIWSATNLRTASKMLLRELINQTQEDKNEYLLRILPDYYGAERVAYNILLGIASENENEYSEDFVSRNVEAGVYQDYSWKSGMDTKTDATYADVMAALKNLKNSQGGNRQYKLVYAIRLYYTIYLHMLLLNDCCNAKSGEKKTNDYCITDFLRDGLFKYTPNGVKSQYLAFWHLSIDAHTLYQKLEDVETGKLDEHTIENVAKEKSLKRLGYQQENDVDDMQKLTFQSSKAFASNWFRVWEQKDSYAKSELISRKDITGTTTLVFHPFYPLFAEMDALTSRQIVNSGVRIEYEPGECGRERLNISMVILLNTDVQQYLLHMYKERKTSESELTVPKEIFIGALTGEPVVTLFGVAKKINKGLDYLQNRDLSGLWLDPKDEKRCLAVLSILPGVQKIYLKCLIKKIEVGMKWLSEAQQSERSANGEKSLNQLAGSTDNSMLVEGQEQRALNILPDEEINLKSLLDDLVNIDPDLLEKLCDLYDSAVTHEAQKTYNYLTGHKALKNDKEKGYGYQKCSITEILKLLEKYRSVLEAGVKTLKGSNTLDKKSTTKVEEKNMAVSPTTPIATQEKQSPYDIYRDVFRALFDELAARKIHIEQILPENDPNK